MSEFDSWVDHAYPGITAFTLRRQLAGLETATLDNVPYLAWRESRREQRREMVHGGFASVVCMRRERGVSFRGTPDSQLQRPLPSSASELPVASVLAAATDEMLITRPGSSAVASLASNSVNLRA